MKKNSFKEFFLTKRRFYRFVFSAILAILLFVSIFFYFFKKDYVRRKFIFPAFSGEYIVEYRNLSKNSAQGDVRFFIDEILLGSQTERAKSLFTPGTKVLSCFQRGDVLYLNLSSDLLKIGDNVIGIKEGFDLLEKNIAKNFDDIKKIEFFVDNKLAFE